MNLKLVKVKPDDLSLGENPRMILFESEDAEKIFVKQMERAGPDHVETLEVFEINDQVYQLHSGYRRLHAAKILNWKFVPCRVLSLLEGKDAFYRAIATNYHRNNLSGYDLVKSVVKLQEKYKQTQDQITKALNISQSYVAELSTVDNFPELLNYLKIGGQISKAISLSRIKKDIDRIAILGSIDSYTTAQLRNIVSDAKHIEVIKPPVESIVEPLESESREASEDEDLLTVNNEGHTPEDFEHPIPRPPGDDGEDSAQDFPENATSPDGEEESIPSSTSSPSTDGEPGKVEPETPTEDAVTPNGYGVRSPPEIQKEEVPPESSSSPWKQGWYCVGCGCFLESGTDGIVKMRNEHTCKDALTVSRRAYQNIFNMVETELLPGNKVGDLKIRKEFGAYQMTPERMKEFLIVTRDLNNASKKLNEAAENLNTYNGRMS